MKESKEDIFTELEEAMAKLSAVHADRGKLFAIHTLADTNHTLFISHTGQLLQYSHNTSGRVLICQF